MDAPDGPPPPNRTGRRGRLIFSQPFAPLLALRHLSITGSCYDQLAEFLVFLLLEPAPRFPNFFFKNLSLLPPFPSQRGLSPDIFGGARWEVYCRSIHRN